MAISALPSETHQPALAERHHGDDQREDHRAGASVPEVLTAAERGVVEVDEWWTRIRRVLPRGREQVVELVERLERVDQQEEQNRTRRRRELRDGDVAQHLPADRAVDGRRLVEGRRDPLQGGEEQ